MSQVNQQASQLVDEKENELARRRIIVDSYEAQHEWSLWVDEMPEGVDGAVKAAVIVELTTRGYFFDFTEA